MTEDASAPPYAAVSDGVRLAIRLTPRAARNELDGVAAGPDGRAVLQLRLAAPPVDGAANKALIAFLADRLRVRKADITIRSGETSRLKILHLAGDARALMARLDEWIRPG
ncbi:MAG TPA: DUF167 domain-containing protein [Aliidongia sp.]|nr:DUF167 domain-containing protein [Aliidongia sp.]